LLRQIKKADQCLLFLLMIISTTGFLVHSTYQDNDSNKKCDADEGENASPHKEIQTRMNDISLYQV